MFQRKQFDAAIDMVAAHYQHSAPTVESWCNWLCSTSGDLVRLSDISLLMTLSNDLPQPNLAANMVYKHQARLGRDTTGQAGF